VRLTQEPEFGNFDGIYGITRNSLRHSLGIAGIDLQTTDVSTQKTFGLPMLKSRKSR
jgi:hypothetical protein